MALEDDRGTEDALFESFQSNLLRSLKEGDSFTDVSLHLGRQGSGTAVINCHKHMLAAQSPVFAQLFLQAANSSQSLTSVSGKSGKVSLRVECDPDAFHDVITYMYCGRINVRGEHAVELLRICLHYEIEPLSRLYSQERHIWFMQNPNMHACAGRLQFLDSYLSIDTVNVLLTSALQFGLEPLVERCEAFILRNAAQTFIHPTMEVVPEEEVCRLLDEDALQILEVEAFVAVLRWGRARYGDKTPASLLKEKLANVMAHVRFPQIEGKDMAETVEPTEIVDNALILEAYRYRATGGGEGGIRSTHNSPRTNSKQGRRFVPRRLGAVPELSTRPHTADFRLSRVTTPSQSGSQGTALVGVGLGLSLHSAQAGMVVTEVAPWCQVHSGELQRMEIGDMVKVVDGWMVTRDVEAVKRRLLGPPNTLVTLGISRCSVEYSVTLVRGSSETARGAGRTPPPKFSTASTSGYFGGAGAGPADMRHQLDEAKRALSISMSGKAST